MFTTVENWSFTQKRWSYSLIDKDYAIASRTYNIKCADDSIEGINIFIYVFTNMLKCMKRILDG